MVLHFSRIHEHRRAVVNLYRSLQRHSSHLEQLELPSFDEFDKRKLGFRLIEVIRRQFRYYKNIKETTPVVNCLQNAIKHEKKLRDLYSEPTSSNVAEIVSILEEHRKHYEESEINMRIGMVRANVDKEPYKTPKQEAIENWMGSNVENQRIDSYITAYVKRLQRDGRLSSKSKLDEEMKTAVLGAEALHEKNLRMLQVEQEHREKGPAQVRIIRTSIGAYYFYFLRYPWGQSDETTDRIKKAMRQSQMVLDLEKSFESNYYQYARMEGEWEYQLDQLDDSKKGVNNTVKYTEEWIQLYRAELVKLKGQLKKGAQEMDLEKEALVEERKEAQKGCDSYHEEKMSRLKIMEDRINESHINHHSDLIGQRLSDQLREHGFKYIA